MRTIGLVIDKEKSLQIVVDIFMFLLVGPLVHFFLLGIKSMLLSNKFFCLIHVHSSVGYQLELEF